MLHAVFQTLEEVWVLCTSGPVSTKIPLYLFAMYPSYELIIKKNLKDNTTAHFHLFQNFLL